MTIQVTGKNLDVGDALRASLHYFAAAIVIPETSAAAQRCSLLLEQSGAEPDTAAPTGWHTI